MISFLLDVFGLTLELDVGQSRGLLYDYDCRPHLIPIRQISRQALGESLQVRVGRTGLFRRRKGKWRGAG